MKKIFFPAIITLSLFVAAIGSTFLIRGIDSAFAQVTDGSSVGSGSVAVPAPKSAHDQLKDPTVDPVGAITDFQDAWKKGKFPFILVVTYALFRLIGYLTKNVKKLSWLNRGRWAAILAACGTVIATMVDVLANGANAYNVGVAGLISAIGAFNPIVKSTEE